MKGKFCVHKKFLNGRKLTPNLMKSLDFLYETPAIAYNRRLPFLNEWLAACGGKASEVKFRCIYEDWNDIMGLVESGMGYSIIPSEIEAKSEDVISKEIPTNVIPATTFYAFFHKDLREMGIVGKMFQDF